jgi:tRNA (cytidine56-2'-O)-methyltransferase
MNEINPEIKQTLQRVNKSWGSNFEIEYIENWRVLLKSKKKDGVKIVHLTMYGQNINDVQKKIGAEKHIIIVVGAEKVPRDVYENADYNVAVGNQPHSEISALAITLDRIQNGKQFDAKFDDARLQIIPSEKGKQVVDCTHPPQDEQISIPSSFSYDGVPGGHSHFEITSSIG